MPEHGRRVHRRAARCAATVLVVGMVMVGTGAASAAPRPDRFAVITFIPASHQVTLTIPTPPCQGGPPGCVWRLWVNEPDTPGAPVLGSATGTSGVLVVTYPATVCGTVQGDASVLLQADVAVGGTVWRYKVGHRTIIPCPSTPPPTPPTPPTSVTTPTTISTVVPPPTTITTVIPPPVGADGQPPSTTSVPLTTTTAVRKAALAQLPFTGIDLEPMVLLGTALVLAGLVLATGLEQRRQALRRLQISGRAQW